MLKGTCLLFLFVFLFLIVFWLRSGLAEKLKVELKVFFVEYSVLLLWDD